MINYQGFRKRKATQSHSQLIGVVSVLDSCYVLGLMRLMETKNKKKLSCCHFVLLVLRFEMINYTAIVIGSFIP